MQETLLGPGLDDAEAARRLATFGPNEPPAGPRRTWLRIAAEALREPMFGLLLLAAALYLLLGDFGEGLFLAAGAALSIGLVVFQEARSERALVALKALAAPTVRVLRGGAERRIPEREVVPGDLMLVGEGERLAADALLIDGDVLDLDESVLTGEAASVARRPRRSGETSTGEEACLLQAGALVLRGAGIAEVLRTGGRTTLGQIGADLARIEETPSPLQMKTRRLVGWLGALAIGFCLVVAVAYALRDGDWVAGTLAGITVAIALIPEEFPMVLAIFFALGAWRLARRQVLVRRTAAIETLGAASILCVDKTGTLTANQMTLARLWVDGRDLPAQDAGGSDAVGALLVAAARASSRQSIDPMDRAVLALSASVEGGGADRLTRSWPLQPERLAVVQLWETAAGLAAAAKGAPEAIFEMCQLEEARRAELSFAVQSLAECGMRVLGVAKAAVAARSAHDPDLWSFEFLGLLGFLDPLRADAPAALAEARDAGVQVAMITGDYPATALEIARQAGIDTKPGVLLGRQIQAMSPDELRAQVRTVRIFARVPPSEKLRLVEALKANGEVVVMTGDGVNDAPALEAAHVGVAMGQRGSAVAREAADIVLLDDSFASIVGGVRLGRRIFANLRKALGYITAIHVPIAGLALAPLMLGWPPLLLPMHVVLLELLIDPICSLGFEAEPSDPEAMRRPPRSIAEPLFGRRQVLIAGLQGAVILTTVLLIYGLALADFGEAMARGAAFGGLVLANLALAYATAATGGAGPFHRSRLVFWGICAIAGAGLAVAYATPALAEVLRIAMPQGALWTFVPASLLAGGWPILARGAWRRRKRSDAAMA
jgi:Ca2+-transporting ATPase